MKLQEIIQQYQEKYATGELSWMGAVLLIGLAYTQDALLNPPDSELGF